MFGRKRQEKILIVKAQGLGDFVGADAAFEAIRDAHKGAQITLATGPTLARLAKAAPYFDVVWADAALDAADDRKRLVGRIKREKFTRVYDLDNSAESARVLRGLKPFAPAWSGAAVGASLRYAPDKSAPSLDAGERFLAQLRVANVRVADRAADLRWALSARKDAANMQPSWYGVAKPYVLLAPASEESRRWPAGQYARLADALKEMGITPVLVGGVEKQAIGDHVARRSASAVNLVGKTDLLQLAALADGAVCFIGDETAPSRLIASIGCPGLMLIANGGASAHPPRGRAIVTVTANALEEIRVEDVMQTLRNAGHLSAATAGLNGADGQALPGGLRAAAS
ncbi:MAG: glycosyltransferase family 9 protein [Pseudomonadota bacterium]